MFVIIKVEVCEAIYNVIVIAFVLSVCHVVAAICIVAADIRYSRTTSTPVTRPDVLPNTPAHRYYREHCPIFSRQELCLSPGSRTSDSKMKNKQWQTEEKINLVPIR